MKFRGNYKLPGWCVLSMTTLLDAIRNKLLLVSLFFGVILVALSVVAASVALWERSRLIIDVGLAAASALGSLVAIALCISSFGSELKNRTAYTVLARPVPRWGFVLGKFLGNVLAMELVTGLMILTTAVTVLAYGALVPAAFWGSMLLTWLEMAIACAIATLFATMTQPVLAACYSVALLIAGNLASDIWGLALKATDSGDVTTANFLRLIYYVLPDLEKLSLRPHAANYLDIPEGFISVGAVYALAYTFAILCGAMWIFSRRKIV